MGMVVDRYSSKYQQFLIAGDVNMQEGNVRLDDFLNEYNAKNMVKEPTCFKSTENPSCIDLFYHKQLQKFS